MISLIIPTYNEVNRLPASLDKLINFLKNFRLPIEVIIVDDASTDKTFQLASQYKSKIRNLRLVRLEKNLGKGWAVKNGMLHAKGEIGIFVDADFSTPIEEINKLIEKIDQGFDIAIGSRALNRDLVKKHQNPLRESMGRFFNFLVQLFAVKGISDTQCGFKAFNLNSTRNLFGQQTIYGFGFDVELLFLAKRNNLKVIEVPTLWYNDPRSNVNPIKDSLLMFYDLLKIRLIHADKKFGSLDKLLFLLFKKRTFAKFALVGLSGTLVDYLAFFSLTRFFLIAPLTANPFSVELAIIWNFTFNNIWTFSKRLNQKGLVNKFLTFQLVSFGGLLLSQIQILLYAHYFSINDLLAKVFTIPLVAIFNYFVNNRWTFRESGQKRVFTFIYLVTIIFLFVLYLLLVKGFTGKFQFFIDK